MKVKMKNKTDIQWTHSTKSKPCAPLIPCLQGVKGCFNSDHWPQKGKQMQCHMCSIQNKLG